MGLIIQVLLLVLNLLEYIMEICWKKFGNSIRLPKRIFKGLFTSLSLELNRKKFTEDTSSLSLEKIKILPSLITSIGYTISLGKTKRIYLNYEVNYYLIDGVRDFGFEIDKRLNLTGGLGYRFGAPAKTTYDGIKNITTVPLKP